MTRVVTFLVRLYLGATWLLVAVLWAALSAALWLALRPLLGSGVQTRANVVRAPATLGPDIEVSRGPDGVWRERDPFAQRDLGDETDVVPEGLGYPAVRDGHLLTLGALHPNDQAIFGPARRP